MKTGAVAGMLFCLGASLSFAQEASDSGPHSLSKDGFEMGSQSGRSLFQNAGRISGTVVTVGGKAVFDVVVQLHDLSTGNTLASAHTNIAGEFSFDMVPYGRYEIVANRAMATIRQSVDVRDSFASVNLQINTSDPNAAPDRNGLVSVAEYKIPRRAREAYAKAEAAIANHRPEEVLKCVEKALEIYPEYAPALTLRGALSLDKNDLATAVDDFEKAIRADRTYAMAYGGMAAALNRLNKFDEALRAAERASSLSPNSFQSYYEMAKSYTGKADYQRALQQLAHAQGLLAQEYAPLHLLKANILLGLENYNDAANELKSLLKIAPNDANSSAARETLARINTFIASRASVASVNAAR